MVRRFLFGSLAALVLVSATPILAQSTDPTGKPFDASAAWASFTKLLHEEYGYFDRPGIDGDAILSAFEQRAKAARSDKEFIDVLQLVSHNLPTRISSLARSISMTGQLFPRRQTCSASTTAPPFGSKMCEQAVMQWPRACHQT